ncbi:MAG: hypothetical protein Q4G08_09515 [Capnocytophaga sp.]|nr:hypothetical protein [Capnocytophaga sp.]
MPPKKEQLLPENKVYRLTPFSNFQNITFFHFLGSGFPLQYTRENAFFARPAVASAGRPRSVGKKIAFRFALFPLQSLTQGNREQEEIAKSLQ